MIYENFIDFLGSQGNKWEKQTKTGMIKRIYFSVVSVTEQKDKEKIKDARPYFDLTSETFGISNGDVNFLEKLEGILRAKHVQFLQDETDRRKAYAKRAEELKAENPALGDRQIRAQMREEGF